MSENEKELKTLQNRANKSIELTGFLTLVFPALGYLYTARYASAFISFLILCLIIFNATYDYAFEAGFPYLFFALITAVENSRSVSDAKNVVQQKVQKAQKVSQPISNNQTPLAVLDVQILKIGKERGEVTMADLVIETGMPPEKVRQTVKELECHDLMRSSNREHDGAVVYRVI